MHPTIIMISLSWSKMYYLYRLFSEAATGGVLKEKVFLEISQNSQEITCVRVSFLIKLQVPATFLKKRLWHRSFSVNFAKFRRTSFLTEHLRWLLLFILWKSFRRDYFNLQWRKTWRVYRYKLLTYEFRSELTVRI